MTVISFIGSSDHKSKISTVPCISSGAYTEVQEGENTNTNYLPWQHIIDRPEHSSLDGKLPEAFSHPAYIISEDK